MEDIIKNPINYSGSKFRILNLIKNNSPTNCNTIIEPFGGTFEVSLNLSFNRRIYNDKNYYLYNLISMFKRLDNNFILETLDSVITEWNLSKTNKDEFYKFREHFNKYNYIDLYSSDVKERDESFIKLLALIYHSFNYFITINKDGQYINTSGYKKSWFNPCLRQKLVKYQDAIKQKVNEIYYMDFINFYKIITDNVNLENIFFFVDPPYIISDDIYSRSYGLKWTQQDEINLYKMLDDINIRGGKFMLTNQLTKGNQTNNLLQEFSEKYKVIDTNVDFAGCSYQHSKKNTQEIIVKNY